MRQVPTDNDDQFVLMSTLDGRELFTGCAFVVLGGVPNISETIRTITPEFLLGWWGAAWVVAGLIALAYRRGAVVDRAERTVMRWWGLWCLPLVRKTRPLTAHTVEVSKITYVSGESFDMTKYPIALVGEGRREVLACGNAISTSWALTQLLADFLGVGISDKTEREVRTTNPLRT